MSRHTKKKLGGGLLQPSDKASATPQIVDDQFAAARERGDQRTEPQIVAERAER